MANKKVFTNLQFEGNSELINPKLNPTGTAPASKGPGQTYFDTGTGGTLNLQFAAAGATNAWKAVHTSGVPFSTDVLFTSTMADGNPPLAITSTSVVNNLNVDMVDGCHASTSATASTIPIYGTNGTLKVSDPLTGDDAANRRYVDSAIQGLDHKESVRIATTENIDVIGTANDLNAGDTIDGVTLVAGDRVLVKSQTSALQNGIYIAPASGVAASRAADDGQGPNLLGDDGNFNDAADLLAWSHNSIGTQGLDNAYLKLTNAGSGSDMRARTNSIALATEIGKTYKFSYYNLDGDSGGFAHLGTTSGGAEIKANVSTGQGTHTFTWQATSEALYIHIGVTAAEANKYTFFDDISVTQVDITDGAFVFVEEGTTQANSSYVLSGDGVTWAQFSGAGQLAVTSNGATAAPLTKSGDTIDFRYSANALSTTGLNKVAQGDFDLGLNNSVAAGGNNGTWYCNLGWSVVANSGVATATGTADNAILQDVGLVAGVEYQYSYDHAETSGGSVIMKYHTGSAYVTIADTGGTDTATGTFTPTATNGNIYFFSYNSWAGTIDNIVVQEANALTVKSGGIDTVHLADDAVEPAKLLETGDFIMGGLGIGATPVNDLQIGTHVAAVGTGNHIAFSNGTNAGALFQSNTFTNIYTSNAYKFWVSGAAAATIAASRKVGIGPDVDSPSGTLHVSTARYGSDNVSGWDINDGTWSKNSYATIVDSNTFTTTQGGSGPWKNAILEVGKTYKVTVAGSTTASSGFNFVNSDGGSGNNLIGSGFGTFTFVAIAGGIYLRNASGGTTDITSLTIVEDTLTTNGSSGVAFTPTISINSGADDLVVANSDHGGITLLNPADKKGTIFFADKGDDDVGSIKYNHSNNSLAFHTNGATASLELDKDQNIKVPTGGVGIGADSDLNAGVKLVLHATDNTMLKLTKAYSGSHGQCRFTW